MKLFASIVLVFASLLHFSTAMSRQQNLAATTWCGDEQIMRVRSLPFTVCIVASSNSARKIKRIIVATRREARAEKETFDPLAQEEIIIDIYSVTELPRTSQDMLWLLLEGADENGSIYRFTISWSGFLLSGPMDHPELVNLYIYRILKVDQGLNVELFNEDLKAIRMKMLL